MTNEELLERLNKYPHLKSRLQALLLVTENTSGEFRRADDAEQAIVDEIRSLGEEMLQQWAEGQCEQVEKESDEEDGLKKHRKKKSTGEQRSG